MKKYLFIASVLFLGIPGANAQSIAIGPTVSTLGIGGEIPIRLNRSFVLRLGGNYLSYGINKDMGDLNYDLKIDFASAGVSLDFHPFRNGLLISGGYFWNNNHIALAATPAQDAVIGGMTFTPAEIGTMKGELNFGKFAPFLGIGYDSTFYTEGALSFSLRFGAFLINDATVSLTADGMSAMDPTFLAELRAEEQNLQNDVNDFGIYPVISIGIKYRF